MLELRNISKSFNHKSAVDSISFTVDSGKIVGLLGPNGAGKTTLIRMINKIITPDEGSIWYQGDLLSEKHLSEIGYLPEERGLYKTMTVADHLLFIGRIRGMSKADCKQQIDYWLDKFEIQDWRKKRIEELSKGMAQKVQFICTVLHQPKLIILDEPFSGFDPVNVEIIQKEIIALKEAGKTILLSSHNMKSVEELCDEVVLIYQSKKVLEGNVMDIKNQRKEAIYGVRFRGAMLGFVNALWTGFELVDKVELGKNYYEVKLKMRGDNDIRSLIKVILDDFEIEAVWEVLPSMQEIFISIVGLSNKD